MKHLGLCILLAVAAVSPAVAQTSTQAPETVTQAFSQLFGDVSGASWHKMASGNWYADVALDTLHAKVEFSPDGNWIATRTAVEAAQLPDTLHTAILQRYPGSTINQAMRIQRADVAAAYYQISLDVAGNERDILANDAGTVTE